MQGWLTGWKEIAAYCHVSIRTVKSYYFELSMPLFRLRKNGPLHGIPDVLNEWLMNCDAIRKEEKKKKK